MRGNCRCCGRNIAYRLIAPNIRHGKQMHPHKCCHGKWCPTGDKLLGQHVNLPRCKYCAIEQGYIRKEENLNGG